MEIRKGKPIKTLLRCLSHWPSWAHKTIQFKKYAASFYSYNLIENLLFLSKPAIKGSVIIYLIPYIILKNYKII